MYRSGLLVMLGRLSSARETGQHLRRLAERNQEPEFGAYSLLIGSVAAHVAWDHESLQRNALAFTEWTRAVGEPANMRVLAQLMHAYADLVAGRTEDAITAARAAFHGHLHEVEGIHAAWSGSILAEALLAAAEYDAAADIARQVIAECRRSHRRYFEAIAHGVIARALLRRDGAVAAAAAARELDAAGRWIETQELRVLEPALAEWRAELAAGDRGMANAAALLEAAIAGYEAMGAPNQVARLQAKLNEARRLP